MARSDDEMAAAVADTVKALLDALVAGDAEAVSEQLSPDSFLTVGVELFGLDALSVPLGFAATPHHIALAGIQSGEGAAIAELRGLDQEEREVAVATLFLSQGAEGGWSVDDIWPVPADSDLQAMTIAEPTSLFYTGELQLPLLEGAVLDPVERALVPGLQEGGFGMHLIERGVHLWRTYRATAAPDMADPGSWAAGTHLAVALLDGRDPDPVEVAAAYAAPMGVAVERFTALMALVSAEAGVAEEQAAPASPIVTPRGPQLLDASGRPIGPGTRQSPDGPAAGRGPSGLILPGR